MKNSILLVDDDPAMREMVADLLSSAGHDVQTAANGREAIEATEGRNFDCILSDIQMPEMDGLALLGRCA